MSDLRSQYAPEALLRPLEGRSKSPLADSSHNAPTDKEWERKQRSREYRVSARREKRNRKADEKKQRKLNATILRRMTRNPEKYNKNAERNRLREIEVERRKIRTQAVRQAERLAAVHDPSGARFNVGEVVTLSDGSVITRQALQRREERLLEKSGSKPEGGEELSADQRAQPTNDHGPHEAVMSETQPTPMNLSDEKANTSFRSKSQLKKLAKYEPRPPPPKPIIPDDIPLSEGEVNWLSLWDLDDPEIERRIVREKRRKVTARKALRQKQQSGKAERRMARDEKRSVYRDLKLEWKTIREDTRVEIRRLRALEDEESKKIAVFICDTERRRALDCCEHFGFTLANTQGIVDITPKVMGMKGVEVDFDKFRVGNRANETRSKPSKQRVDLSGVLDHSHAQYVSTERAEVPAEIGDFVELNVGDDGDFERLSYNHKLRRKIVRAIERAETEKEMLVRQRTIEHLERNGLPLPAVLQSDAKPVNLKGRRILENGVLETAKQERVRSRVDLAEFNDRMRVLRRQAKEAAIYAGLRKHAEVSGGLGQTLEYPE